MTKRHFIALADALNIAHQGANSTESELVWHDTVSLVADVCNHFNDRFDRARFLAAATKKG